MSKCQESIIYYIHLCYRFLYDHTSTDDDNTRSLDSGICCSDSPKGSPELTDSSAQLCNHITSNLTCLSSNSQRSPLTHNLDRSSFDDDLERSLSFGDDSDAYYTANSDENDDALLDSGYFQPNQLQDLHNCTAGINTRHVSNNLTTSSPISSPMNIHSGVTCCRNSSYCSYHAHYNSHSCKGSCQLESMHMKHRLVADISPGLSSPALLGMNERSKKILDCRFVVCIKSHYFNIYHHVLGSCGNLPYCSWLFLRIKFLADRHHPKCQEGNLYFFTNLFAVIMF